jgi:hypothetical protein
MQVQAGSKATAICAPNHCLASRLAVCRCALLLLLLLLLLPRCTYTYVAEDTSSRDQADLMLTAQFWSQPFFC